MTFPAASIAVSVTFPATVKRALSRPTSSSVPSMVCAFESAKSGTVSRVTPFRRAMRTACSSTTKSLFMIGSAPARVATRRLRVFPPAAMARKALSPLNSSVPDWSGGASGALPAPRTVKVAAGIIPSGPRV